MVEPRRRAEQQKGPGPAPSSLEIELGRLRSEAAFHQRLRDLTVAFSRGVSSTLDLENALETLAIDTNAVLGARRTSVWLHQRRLRRLTLAGSSDRTIAQSSVVVATDDPDAPPAQGLRLERPALIAGGAEEQLLAPLRGRRRALGTLVVDGPFGADLTPAQLLDLTHELSGQLSAAIENIQLLEEVLRQRRLLEDTFNSIVDLVVVTDNQLQVVQMNDAFLTRTGLSRAELLERPLDTLIGSEMAAWAAAVEAAGPGPDGVEGARTNRFEDPRLGGTFSVTMTPLINAGGNPAGHVLVARDVTDQTRLEKEQRALRERLGQSERLASLGQFVAGIAHEMNNPLQGVLGHLELMIATSEQARPLRPELRRIYRDADRAAKIVRNLLVFTGSRRMSRRRLRVNRILSRVLTSRAPSLKRGGIQVTRDEPADLPAVTGDPLLIHQAFLNLVINAEHAVLDTGLPGRIEVRASYDPIARTIITTVRDSGAGIPADVLPRIFDPFFTTKEVGQGTGLGLAITYGIVQEHGGTIQAANAAGGGAVFTIALPEAVEGLR